MGRWEGGKDRKNGYHSYHTLRSLYTLNSLLSLTSLNSLHSLCYPFCTTIFMEKCNIIFLGVVKNV